MRATLHGSDRFWRLRSTRRASQGTGGVSTRRSFCTGSAKRCARRMSHPGPGMAETVVALVPDASARVRRGGAPQCRVSDRCTALAQAIYAETLGMNHARTNARSRRARSSSISRAARSKSTARLQGAEPDGEAGYGTFRKTLFQPLRAALTGELDGPEMAKLLRLSTRSCPPAH